MNKLTAWFTAHKPEVALGAGGIVVTIALYVRSRNAASTSSSTTGTGTTASTTEIPTTADTTDSDVYNGLESQILGLQQATLALGTTPATSTGAAPAPTGLTVPPLQLGGAPTAGGTEYAGNTFGVQTPAAAPYDTGQEVVGGNPYTNFAFPGGTTVATMSEDLFPGGNGGGVMSEYDPSGATTFELPVYPNEPVVSH